MASKRKKSLVGWTVEDWEMFWQEYEDYKGKPYHEVEYTEIWKTRKRCKFYSEAGKKSIKVRITIEEI